MAVSIIGSVAFFGRGWPGKLPKGWELIESDEDWSFGKSPDGQLYYLSPDGSVARPCRIAKKAVGLLKPGDRYMDTETGVIDLTTINPS